MRIVSEAERLGDGPGPEVVVEGVLVDTADVQQKVEIHLVPPAFGTGARDAVLHIHTSDGALGLEIAFEDLARWVDEVREARAVWAEEQRETATSAAWARVRMLGEAEASARLGRPAHLEHTAGRLLARITPDGPRYPADQFTSDGCVSPAVPRLRALAAQHDWSEDDLILWLATPTGYLGDQVPADLLASDLDAVVAAFDQHAGIVW
ncbi:hypothetical protein [uncultured Aeromicrobium sp.]|uniref:hypothetical protein n=1 Tax=uncultured Aeromicrobium sp. TaxID=337820 RepID=UPI0025E960D8|nr:hypothetical protein [uncultured Aeromicrobium sp.]